MGRGKRQRSVARELSLSDSDGRSRVLPALSLALEPTMVPEVVKAPAQPRPLSSSPAANAASRKQQKPELYCPRCLWMTGGGSCERHGGAKWSKERERLARKRSGGLASAEEIAQLESSTEL
jgi:hypothetical protein